MNAPHQVIAAAEAVVTLQFASITTLHRQLKLGYDRAGQLLDELERLGVVGPAGTGSARDVLIKPEGLSDLIAQIEATP